MSVSCIRVHFMLIILLATKLLALCLIGTLLPSYCLTFLFFFFLLTSPIVILCTPATNSLWHLVNCNSIHRYLLYAVRSVLLVLSMCVSCMATIGVVWVLIYTAIGIMIFLHLAVTYVLSEKILPFLTCCVLVCCYVCESYRSFTHEYQDLALRLFEQYNQFAERAQNRAAIMQKFTSKYGRSFDGVKRIPKELFDMACEELMPITKRFCAMSLKAALSSIFVVAIFSFTVLLNASSVFKTSLVVLFGLFPKLVTIYVERRWRKHPKTVPMNENYLKIMQEYINVSDLHHVELPEKGIEDRREGEMVGLCMALLYLCITFIASQYSLFIISRF